MTQRELLYVKTIVEEKSISKAAKKLYIAQPSLSQCLSRLEQSLGTPLFQRTTSGLLPTFAGEKYYQLALKILKMYEDFEIEISDINNLRTGRIHIGITNHLAVYVLPQVLPEYRKICPFIEIHVLEETSTQLEKSLVNGQIDFAIMHFSEGAANPLIDYEPLVTDPFILAVEQNHPLCAHGIAEEGLPYPKIDLNLFRNEPFILLAKNQRIRQISDIILNKAKINPHVVLTIKNYETAKRLTSVGIGVTFIPLQYSKISAHEMPPAYFFIDENFQASWDMCIATAKGGFKSKADELFLRIIRKRFKNEI